MDHSTDRPTAERAVRVTPKRLPTTSTPRRCTIRHDPLCLLILSGRKGLPLPNRPLYSSVNFPPNRLLLVCESVIFVVCSLLDLPQKPGPWKEPKIDASGSRRRHEPHTLLEPHINDLCSCPGTSRSLCPLEHPGGQRVTSSAHTIPQESLSVRKRRLGTRKSGVHSKDKD